MTKQTKLRRAPARKAGWSFFGFLGKTIIVLIVLSALPLGYFGLKIWNQMKDIPDISVLEKYEPIEAVQIYDKNDKLVCTVEGDEDRQVVHISQVATQMQQAILAAEDHHFYEHHGINPVSIVRAFFINLQAGHVVEGGSTITQQLIKNLFFEDKGRTLDRKLKEAVISYEVERRYSKDRILEMYLNQVYFGNGGYGIERAAQRWFGRSAASLDLSQSAFLAGLVKAPSELGDPEHREAALQRQHEIIDRMVEFGYITPQQAQKAKQEKLAFKKSVNPLNKYPYYVSYVLEELRGRFSETEMRRQGLKVLTNLDPQVQALAEKTLNADLKTAPKGVTQGALVCVSVKDGSVLALVGGVGDFWKNQFNRATNPHTAGSSFKPFVYLTAFMRNIYSPDSFIDDSAIVIKQGWGMPDWIPHNFDHKFRGRITIREALCQSRNVPAVKVGKAAGVENIVETARLAGITSKLEPNLSIALGSSAVTPLDMAGAYSTFARGGIAIKPQVIRRIENNRGQTIEVFDSPSNKVFDADSVARLVDVMQDVVRRGTGTAARLPDRPVAGKTGTADEGKDIWFVGYTPDTVCAVWGGNDEDKPIPGHNVTGGAVMAKIWKDFMTAYYDMRPTAPGFFAPPSKQMQLLASPDATADDGNGTNMPNLVPIAPEAENGAETPPFAPPIQRDQSAGVPPPAVSPTTQIPDSQLTPSPNPAPTYAPSPLTAPRAPNAVPQATPAPAMQPSYQSAPPLAPSYYGRGQTYPPSSAAPAPGYSGSGGRSATVYTSSGAKRTIINDENGTAGASYADGNVSPGLGQRRFAPVGGIAPQPTNSQSGQTGTGF